MFGIQAEAVRRRFAFSAAIAEQPDVQVVQDPNAATATRRKGSNRNVAHLLSLPNIPEEGSGFIKTYIFSIDSNLVVNRPGEQRNRRPFDPEAKCDRDLLHPSVLLGLLADSNDLSMSSMLSVKNEGVKCK
jgi:hypothetical protein